MPFTAFSMKTRLLLLLCLYGTMITRAQDKMRPLATLINLEEPGWTMVSGWIAKARNKIEVLPADSAKAADALYKSQVTTRSPMGAIIFNTGGLLVDNGWIRILGSGNTKLNRSLPDWNKGKAFNEFGEAPAFLLIADDAMGGFFFLNGGGLGKDAGKIYYWPPDDLNLEPLGITYSEFLDFCFNNDLDEFYKGSRWPDWKKETGTINGDQVFNFMPPLWSKEGSVQKSTRTVVPVQQQYDYNLKLRQGKQDKEAPTKL